jgi:hypothetical protein
MCERYVEGKTVVVIDQAANALRPHWFRKGSGDKFSCTLYARHRAAGRLGCVRVLHDAVRTLWI